MADLKWVIENGDIEQLRKLTFDVNEIIKGRTVLHMAADYGQFDIIKYLVDEKKADVNAYDSYGTSVLLTAIYEDNGHNRYKECIKFLVERGAKKEGTAADGSSYADCTNDAEIKKLLK